jgi:tyrosine-protein phosphatase YwqE
MHSHLLFGIDDGAPTVEDSIQLIKELMALGYTRFITTPHIYRDLYFNSPDTILPKLDAVRQALKENQIDVQLDTAAEYFLDEHFEELIEKEELLTFGDRHVLFEISFDSEPPMLNRAIFNMQLRGYKPILAHPERYEFWHRDFDRYRSLAERGVLLQVNINCLTGHYGPQVRRISEKMIDEKLVSFLGTDCHHLGHINLTKQASELPYLHKAVLSGQLKNLSL